MTSDRRYSAVLFDLDGTLVDSFEALTTAVNTVRRAAHKPAIEMAIVRGYVGEGVDKLLERVLESEKADDSLRRVFEESYNEICCQQSVVLTDVMETLGRLSISGIRMAVCTNKPTGFSRKILEHFGMASHFDAIVGPDLALARKPDKRHLLHTLAFTGREVSDALFVGDMPIDVVTARNSGVDVATVATGPASREELAASRPDFMLDRFSDLVSLVLPSGQR